VDIIGRLKGDPEERPLDQRLVVPDSEFVDAEMPPDEGDAKEDRTDEQAPA
jgi:hypothetical protein